MTVFSPSSVPDLNLHLSPSQDTTWPRPTVEQDRSHQWSSRPAPQSFKRVLCGKVWSPVTLGRLSGSILWQFGNVVRDITFTVYMIISFVIVLDFELFGLNVMIISDCDFGSAEWIKKKSWSSWSPRQEKNCHSHQQTKRMTRSRWGPKVIVQTCQELYIFVITYAIWDESLFGPAQVYKRIVWIACHREVIRGVIF